MPDQNQAPNPPQTTKVEPHQPTENSAPEDVLVSTYPHKRSRKRWILLFSIIVLAVAGVFLWHYFSGFESTDDAQVDVHLYPVSARISGYIQKVNVDDNQWVDAGSTLVEIDPKDYEVALARAKATIDSSKATAESLGIDVPVSSVDTSSQLKFTSSDIDNAKAAIEADEKASCRRSRLPPGSASGKCEGPLTLEDLSLVCERYRQFIFRRTFAKVFILKKRWNVVVFVPQET